MASDSNDEGHFLTKDDISFCDINLKKKKKSAQNVS